MESIALGAFCGVATVVLQRLLFGQTNLTVSIVLTVLIEVVYFKTLAKRF